VFALAELRSATAITDDQEAVRVARFHGLDVHGTIWLLAGACRDGKLSQPAAVNLIDALRATGLRLPCTGARISRLRAPARTPAGVVAEGLHPSNTYPVPVASAPGSTGARAGSGDRRRCPPASLTARIFRLAEASRCHVLRDFRPGPPVTGHRLRIHDLPRIRRAADHRVGQALGTTGGGLGARPEEHGPVTCVAGARLSPGSGGREPYGPRIR
jgi:hypothetical protein